jgi:hypothetical protein
MIDQALARAIADVGASVPAEGELVVLPRSARKRSNASPHPAQNGR